MGAELQMLYELEFTCRCSRGTFHYSGEHSKSVTLMPSILTSRWTNSTHVFPIIRASNQMLSTRCTASYLPGFIPSASGMGPEKYLITPFVGQPGNASQEE